MNVIKSSRVLRSLTQITFVFSLLASSAFAQGTAPDFMFRFRTDDGSGGPYPQWTTVPSSWNHSYPFSSNGIDGELVYSGSTSGSSISLTASSEQSRASNTSQVNSWRDAKYSVRIYVKGPASVDLAAGTSASASNSSSSEYWRVANFGPIPYGSSFVEAYIESGNDDVSDSDTVNSSTHYSPSCSPSGATTFSEYPGVNYYLVEERSFSAKTVAQGGFAGSLEVAGTVTFSGEIGGDAPQAEVDGPFVSSVLKPNPAVGDSVTITNISYDPDDTSSGTALTGICAAAWTVRAPDGTESHSSTLGGVSFTASKQGGYRISLTVTDNEGETADTSIDVVVGNKRPLRPDQATSCLSVRSSRWELIQVRGTALRVPALRCQAETVRSRILSRLTPNQTLRVDTLDLLETAFTPSACRSCRLKG